MDTSGGVGRRERECGEYSESVAQRKYIRGLRETEKE